MPAPFKLAETRRSQSWRVYIYLIVGGLLVYLLVRSYGNTLSAPAAGAKTISYSSVHVNDFLHVLLALALVIATARGLGAIFKYVQQPPVIGEMIAGNLARTLPCWATSRLPPQPIFFLSP